MAGDKTANNYKQLEREAWAVSNTSKGCTSQDAWDVWEIQRNESNGMEAKAMEANVERQLLAGSKEGAPAQTGSES